MNLIIQSDINSIISEYGITKATYGINHFFFNTNHKENITYGSDLEKKSWKTNFYQNPCDYEYEFVLKLKDAMFVDNSKIIIDINKNVLLTHPSVDLIYSSNEYTHIYDGIKINKKYNLNGRVLLLSSTFGAEYWHFLFQVLPRLRITSLFNLCLDSFDYIVFPELRKYVKDWLKIIDFPIDKIIECPNPISGNAGNAYYCSELYAPSNYQYPNLESITFLRNNVSKHIQDGNRLIYFTRKGQKRGRHIVDEDSLFKISLEKFGFEYILIDELSILQQVQLISSARIIIAPHGGLFANCIYMKKGTTMIEIMHPKYMNHVIGYIARSLNMLRFYCIGIEHEENILLGTNKIELIDQCIENCLSNG